MEDKSKRVEIEPTYSMDAHSQDWWDPELMTRRFGSLLQCQNEQCGETVFVTGNILVEEGHDEEFGLARWDVLEPLTSHPPVAVFPVSDCWPESVTKQLRKSFSHIWYDPGAAGNRLRTTVECLLDEQGVRKFPRTGPRRAINLHDRILQFQSQNADAANFLLAVKWLGNTGSHSDAGLRREDVLDGMELLENALHLLYDDTPRRLARMARDINRRRGPRKRR